jgi:hypothetical protein
MRKTITVLVCIFLFFVVISNNLNIARANDSIQTSLIMNSEHLDENTLDLKEWAKDTGDILSSPVHWDNSDWNKFLLYAGGTYLIYKNDNDIRNWFQERRSHDSNNIARFGNALPGLGVIYLQGTYFLGSEKQRQTAVVGLESTSIAVVATEVLKTASHHQRPGSNNEKDSFPSGHTAASFALATVFSHEYNDKKYVAPITYGLATLTGLSRLNNDRHWASDVFAGALVGYFTAKQVIKLHENQNADIKLTPYTDTDTVGIIVTKSL